MRTHLTRFLAPAALAAGLALGGVACDDTADGVGEDTEDNVNEVDEELDTEDAPADGG